MHDPSLTIRKLKPEDVEPLNRILEETGVFTDEEVATALELMDIFLNVPGQKDYDLYSAVIDCKEIGGYVCVGPRPLTKGTFDLYWIAVKPSSQGRGIGKKLTKFAEDIVRTQGGRLLIAETSSLPRYKKTWEFYRSNRFEELARIKDYYTLGDDLVIYGKYLS
jgi:ribosomal protein S18 acetylase RimI-like enzyme